MYYAYLSSSSDAGRDSIELIKKYAKDRNITLADVIEDSETNKVHWGRRRLNHLLNKTMSKGDAIIVYEASDLARSTLQVLEVLDLLSDRGLVLHLVKYGEVFTAGKFYDTEAFLKLIKAIESEFVTKRTTDALARRRAAGLPLGRPKGRKNKSRKLDKYRPEIKKYLALGINKASIAKLVGCHAQTLYNYLEDTDLVEPGSLENLPFEGEDIALDEVHG
ncbi:MAG: resolvase [Gammaproteobacteria bacterium]|nr:resolvase [Gammaproteobacteria bacterium]